jgi:hypothetical protein
MVGQGSKPSQIIVTTTMDGEVVVCNLILVPDLVILLSKLNEWACSEFLKQYLSNFERSGHMVLES